MSNQLCNYCDGEVIGMGGGDEVLDYCPSCEIIVEGNTHDGEDDE